MRYVHTLALGSLCLLASCAITEKMTHERNEDWYESGRDRKIDLPEFAYVEGNYTAEIVRMYDGKKELKLLRFAESVYPNRERVLEANQDAQFTAPGETAQKEPLWWYASFDGIRIPFAITTAAVRYYSDLVEAYKNQDFSATNGIAVTNAQMRYAGVIDHHKWFAFQGKSFPECYVASMELIWRQNSGPEHSLRFVKKRLVVLDPHGKILGVFLDGPADVTVD